MPLPSSKNISRKLGKNGKSTASIIEDLKLQHAEELARANKEHKKEVALLEYEVEQCRSEIETLKACSEEHSDTLMPLPSPSKSLKFVTNTRPGRPTRKGGMWGNKQVVGMVAELKAKQNKDLARVTEVYGRKLHSLKKEVDRYKAETEALQASESRGSKHGCDGTGVSKKTGVAEKDKENISQKAALSKNQIPPTMKTSKIQNNSKLQHQSGGPKKTRGSESLEESDILRDQYERLFLEDYQFERDPAYEGAIGLGSDNGRTANNEDVDEMCKELIDFMAEVKIKCLGT